MKYFLYLILPLSCLAHHRTEVHTLFLNANELSEKGEYQQAQALYERCLQSVESENIHFNLGNTAFKNGDIGRAILEYEKALSLNPRDKEARRNLAFVRKLEQLTGLPLPKIFNRWNLFTLNQWLTLLSIAFWGLIAGIVLWIFYGIRSVWLKAIMGILILLGALSSLTFFYSKKRLQYAIVLLDNAPLKVAPTEHSPAKKFLQSGSYIKILAEQQTYYFVENDQTEEGWIDKAAIGRI